MLPHVILQNGISLDARIDWLEQDLEQYYGLVASWDIDVHLAGSNTIYNPDENIEPPDDGEYQTEHTEQTKQTETKNEPQSGDVEDTRPILAVPDSHGRVRNWHMLRNTPYWRKHIALCSETTPKEYLDYLKENNIDFMIVGPDKVDLKLALEELNERFGAKNVLLDSGGTLNGIMLRAGLVNEVSILINPCLVGGSSQKSFYRAPDLTSAEEVVKLKLRHVEKLKHDVVWLRYDVLK